MSGQRAVVLEPGVVQVEAFELPAPQAGEVLVRTRTTLISPGTERAFFLALPTTNANYPLYPGYSNIGEVIATGAGVSQVQVGDRVASAGGHASHVVLPAEKCLPVPAALRDQDAVFFNLIAIAMQGVRKARIELGEAVAVIGAGPIGAFALQLARHNGGLPVIAVDRDTSRLAMAEQLGADVTLLSDEGTVEALKAQTRGAGAAVVIEATGVPAAILLAFQLAAVRGRVSLLGSARGETEGVNFYRDVHRKGLQILGAHEITRPLHDSLPGWWTQHDEQRAALDMLALGRLTASPLVSHHFGWAAFPAAYALLAEWDSGATGMIVDWS